MASRVTLEKVEALEARIQELESSSTRRKKEKLDVPRPCRHTIRTVMEKLKKATDDQLLLTYNSKEEDEEAMKRVVRETRRLYADQGWAVGTCEEAFWRVWTNKRDDIRSHLSGKAEAPGLSSKNNKRMKNKLESRKKTLATINWPEKKKQKVLPLLRKELTSPMVSDEEDDNLLLSIPFSWESQKLAPYKRQFDYQRVYNSTARSRKNMKSWARHPTATKECELPRELDIPSWGVSRPDEDLNNIIECA